MKRWFLGLSLRSRLCAAFVCACLLALFTALLLGLPIQRHRMERQLAGELRVLAEVVARNAQEALASGDGKRLDTIVQVFAGKSEVSGAAISDAQGKILARYDSGNGEKGWLQEASSASGIHIGHGFLQLRQPVLRVGEEIGSVSVLASLQAVQTQLLGLAVVVTLCFALGLLLAVFFLHRLLARLCTPLGGLSQRLQRLSGKKRLPLPESGQGVEAQLQAIEAVLAQLEDRQRKDELQRQRREQELVAARKAVKAAEAANRSKSAVLAAVSHELRTPLNAMVGMARLALETQPEGRLRHCLQTLRSSGESLQGIVADLLDMSQIEAGRLRVRTEPFHLKRLCEEVCATMRFAAAEKGLHLACSVAEELAPVYRGDALRLRQILLNLVGNAIKCTATGRVDLAVALGKKTPEQGNFLHFSVRDTGMGIAPEERERIFEAFAQGEDGALHGQGGVGLGLAISRQLVTLLGGSIWVESVPGQGSTFHFTAALEKALAEELEESTADRGPAATTSAAAAAATRILVVDDNEANRDLIRMMLEKRHRVSGAGDGLQALELLAGPEHFDCVLMDVQMPVVDGLTITRTIRALERGEPSPYPLEADLAKRLGARLADKRLTIVAMTACAASDDRARCLEAGMDGYVAKPFQPEQLYRVLGG